MVSQPVLWDGKVGEFLFLGPSTMVKLALQGHIQEWMKLKMVGIWVIRMHGH